jgi:hypothetical protein
VEAVLRIITVPADLAAARGDLTFVAGEALERRRSNEHRKSTGAPRTVVFVERWLTSTST